MPPIASPVATEDLEGVVMTSSEKAPYVLLQVLLC
jgi:hypothetical protein